MRNIPLLRITFFLGIMLVLLLGGVLVAVFINGRSTAGDTQESAFRRLLQEYDYKSRQILETGQAALQRRELDRLDNDLDRLEHNAEVVESWLSVLKRRRQLAGIDSRYEQSYRESAQRAALAFPHSEPIAAVASAALIYNSAITREGEANLRNILPLLSSPRFAPIRLSMHVLLGDFKNPEQAEAQLPRGFTEPGFFFVSTLETEIILPDLMILKILAGNIPSVSIDMQTALNVYPSPALIRLGAEFFYDFGDLLHSAELFSMLPDDEALSRQADALWLIGYTENARAIWAMQTMRNKSLYNLALTAPAPEEKTELFERLMEQPRSGDWDSDDNISRRFGLIRLSRLYDTSRAIAVLNLEKMVLPYLDYLIDLEILRRRMETTEMPRMIAETWLLLDRYYNCEEIYQWGAWYFEFQRNYTESAKLLQLAKRHNFDGNWMSLHGALQHIREGDLTAAEDTLARLLFDAQETENYWVVAANLGRVLESLLAPAKALTHYERAMAVLTESDDDDDAGQLASKIQVRIALCLKTFGRIEERQRALEYALDLNPENITARLELSGL
jgi:tetratricopeptide (TPR) repeat protein